jgi:hypothetical protein
LAPAGSTLGSPVGSGNPNSDIFFSTVSTEAMKSLLSGLQFVTLIDLDQCRVARETLHTQRGLTVIDHFLYAVLLVHRFHLSFQIVKLCFLKNTSGSKPGDWCCHSISRACKAGMEVCYLSRRRASGALPISWRRANLRAALKVSSDNKANWAL